MQDDLSIIVELVNKLGCEREKEAMERICAAIAEPAVTSTNIDSTSAAQIFADREVAIFMGDMISAFAEFCGSVNRSRQKLRTV